jgi:BirA family biotin operon repressor/biotin-[acetyl-CoA-carboxylase] ligase
MAGCVVHESIKDLSGLSPHLKWPNDIHLKGRKVGGILSELVTANHGSYVVLGIGINVNTQESDLADDIRSASTSLLRELDAPMSIEELLVAIVSRMDWWLASDPLLSKVHHVFNRISGTIGTRVVVRVDEQIIKGIARCMLEDGALLIETDSGETYEMQAGDVEYLRSEE